MKSGGTSEKIRYKAVYRDPEANPFRPIMTVPTKTVDIDGSVSHEQVEQWAREDQGDYIFVRLEVVDQHRSAGYE